MSEAISGPRSNFPADAYVGLAESYARFRVQFPDELIQDLLSRTRCSGAGMMLDLACGAGRATLPLAPHFSEVWAVDCEPEMIAVAKRKAERQGLSHIKWSVKRVEEFEARSGSCDLVTIADAFHRLDQACVPALVFRWLKPGGFLANLSTGTIVRDKSKWQEVVAEVVHRWGTTSATQLSSPTSLIDSGPEHETKVMAAVGFIPLGDFTFFQLHNWTFESILGYLHSTSYCSKKALGKNAESFASELNAALTDYDAAGIYPQIMHFAYTIGRKPHEEV